MHLRQRLLALTVMGLALPLAGMAQNPDPAVASGGYSPLSTEDRLALYTHETFRSRRNYLAALGSAAGDQLGHEPSEWGQGASGYGRRVASKFSRFVIQDTIHHGVAAALGLDPRYLPCECHGFWRRTGYAIKMSFLTNDQHGHKRPDVAFFAGAYGGGMLSTFWYPRRYSPMVEGVRAGNIQVGFQIGTQILKEFEPELKRSFHLKD